MKRPVRSLGTIAILLLLSGIIGMLLSYFHARKWQAANAQPVVNNVNSFHGGRGLRYRGEIELQWLFQDRIYVAPYSLPVSHTTFEGARDDLIRFRPGTLQQVFVNPDDPFDFLFDLKKPRFFAVPIVLLVCGVVVGLISIFMIWSLGLSLCPSCAASVALYHKYCVACAHRLPRQKKLIRTQ